MRITLLFITIISPALSSGAVASDISDPYGGEEVLLMLDDEEDDEAVRFMRDCTSGCAMCRRDCRRLRRSNGGNRQGRNGELGNGQGGVKNGQRQKRDGSNCEKACDDGSCSRNLLAKCARGSQCVADCVTHEPARCGRKCRGKGGDDYGACMDECRKVRARNREESDRCREQCGE